VCRGGGTTVAELTAAGRASVVVPYPHHRDRQQLHNAEVLARVGAAIIVEERVLTVDGLARLLTGLLADRSRLEVMGRAARRLRAVDPAGAILRDMGLSSSHRRGATHEPAEPTIQPPDRGDEAWPCSPHRQ
jgi:UDP-N-acetylglucosamine--N-acetylmuramyl-(pentapeptide) pyrophosphoryl-undecaprenol N-acetylglucosamine transferase